MNLIGKPLHFVVLAFIFLLSGAVQGQLLKKLGKRAERAAERTIERRVDKETTEKTDAALDSILEPGSKENIPDPEVNTPPPTPSGGQGTGSGNSQGTSASGGSTAGSDAMQVYSKFDYVPGDKVLFFDDFASDFIGDFPSRWNTNGSGEVVTINNDQQKWLKLLQGYGILYIPDISDLPEDYTIEFDLLTRGMDQQTSSNAGLTVQLDSEPGFRDGSQYVWTFIPFGQYGAFDIRVRNFAAGVGSDINSGIKADIRKAVLNKPHISIAVNGQRFRMWINENKFVDIPRFIPEGGKMTTLKFNLNGLKDGKEDLFITNLKVAEGGVDLRRELLSEGSVSTNGILFDSGSARIQPQSMGIIRQISQVLQQEPGLKLKIVGHTDADGDESSNMELSRKRAEAVRNSLISVYQIDAARLTSEGKGETDPVADNGSSDGKAQNRRVQFIKTSQ